MSCSETESIESVDFLNIKLKKVENIQSNAVSCEDSIVGNTSTIHESDDRNGEEASDSTNNRISDTQAESQSVFQTLDALDKRMAPIVPKSSYVSPFNKIQRSPIKYATKPNKIPRTQDLHLSSIMAKLPKNTLTINNLDTSLDIREIQYMLQCRGFLAGSLPKIELIKQLLMCITDGKYDSVLDKSIYKTVNEPQTKGATQFSVVKPSALPSEVQPFIDISRNEECWVPTSPDIQSLLLDKSNHKTPSGDSSAKVLLSKYNSGDWKPCNPAQEMSAEIAPTRIMKNDFNINAMSQQRLTPASSRNIGSPQVSVTQTTVTRTVIESSSDSESEDDAAQRLASRQASSERANNARALLAGSVPSPAKPAPTFVRVPAPDIVETDLVTQTVNVVNSVTQEPPVLVSSTTSTTQNISTQNVSTSQVTTTTTTVVEESDSDDSEPAQSFSRQTSSDRASSARALLAASTPSPAKSSPSFTRVSAPPTENETVQVSQTVNVVKEVVQQPSVISQVTTKTTTITMEESDSDSEGEVTPTFNRQASADRAAQARALLAKSAPTPEKKEPTFVRVPAKEIPEEKKENPVEQPAPVQQPEPQVSHTESTTISLVDPTQSTQYVTETQERVQMSRTERETTQEVTTQETTTSVVESVEVIENPAAERDNSDIQAIMEMARNAALLAAKSNEPSPLPESPKTPYTPVSYVSSATPPPQSVLHQRRSFYSTQTIEQKVEPVQSTEIIQKQKISAHMTKSLDFSSDSEDNFKSDSTSTKFSSKEPFRRLEGQSASESEKQPPRVSNFTSAGMVQSESVTTTTTSVKQLSFLELSADSEDSGPLQSDFLTRIQNQKSMRGVLDTYNVEPEKQEPTFVHIEAEPIPEPPKPPSPKPKAISPKFSQESMQYGAIYQEEQKKVKETSSKKYNVTRMESQQFVAVPEELEPQYNSGNESEPRSRYYRAQSPEYARQQQLLEEANARKSLSRNNSFGQSEYSSSEYTSSVSHMGPLDQYRQQMYSAAPINTQPKSYNDNIPLKPESDLQQLLAMGLSEQEAIEICNEHIQALMIPPEMRPYEGENDEGYIISRTVTRRLVRESRHRHHDQHTHRGRTQYESSRSYRDSGRYSGDNSVNRSRNEIYYEDETDSQYETDSYYDNNAPVRYANGGSPRSYYANNSPHSYSGPPTNPRSTYIENDPYRGRNEMAHSDSFYSQESSYDPRYHQQSYAQNNHSDSFYSQSEDSVDAYGRPQFRNPNESFYENPRPSAMHYNPNHESFYGREDHHQSQYIQQQGHNDSFYSQDSQQYNQGYDQNFDQYEQVYEPPAVQRSDTRSTVSSLGRSSFGATEDYIASQNNKKRNKKNRKNQSSFQPMEPIYEQNSGMVSSQQYDPYYQPRGPPSVAQSQYDDYYTEDNSEIMTMAESEYADQYNYRGGQSTKSSRRGADSVVDEREELNALLEMQEERYGVNMFDSLQPNDERRIHDLLVMGYSRNIATQLIFEERYGRV